VVTQETRGTQDWVGGADMIGSRAMNKLTPATNFIHAPSQERFTGDQIMDIVRLGLVSEDADFELIDGAITPMASKGPLHEEVREAITLWLRRFPLDLLFIVETTLSSKPRCG
jgi:hypothetical protein